MSVHFPAIISKSRMVSIYHPRIIRNSRTIYTKHHEKTWLRKTMAWRMEYPQPSSIFQGISGFPLETNQLSGIPMTLETSLSITCDGSEGTKGSL